MPRTPNKYKGAKVYNRLLKEFSKINNKLPEDRKLSLQTRRKIISDSLYPAFKNTAPSRIRVKDVRGRIFGILEQIPPSVECNPLYVDNSLLSQIEFFALEEILTIVLPQCINVKITAFEFGNTNIFNTRNYSYYATAIKNITENIRAATQDASGRLMYNGFKRLIQGKPNNGKGENYFIDFILESEQYDDAIEVINEDEPIPQPTARNVSSIKEEISQRFKQLKVEKRKKSRLNKKHADSLGKIRALKKKNKSSKVEKRKQAFKKDANVLIVNSIKRLKRAFDNGTITNEVYVRKLNEILGASFKRGGKI